MNKREIGAEMEQLAVKCLENKGYTIIRRNYRIRLGEIDIIAKDGKYVVFVEVKYRSSRRYGSPVEAVTTGKQNIIRRVAAYYLTTEFGRSDVPCRFDVIGIDGCKRDGDGNPEIMHIANAF